MTSSKLLGHREIPLDYQVHRDLGQEWLEYLLIILHPRPIRVFIILVM